MRIPQSGLRRLPLSKETLVELYWNSGLTAQEIAHIYSISAKTIWAKMKRWNISTKVTRKLAGVTKNELMNLYENQGLTTYQIAKIFSVDPSTVWDKLHSFNIPLRKSGGCKRGTRGLGRHKTTKGYVRCLIPNNSPYIVMARPDGYVLEHRLVMAQHLGRPLLRTEIVHHRPDVAKDDNRIEVLYLMPNPGDHSKLSPCSKCELKKEIRLLRWQIKEQSEQIRNLSAKIMGVES